jgi:hypothetical protein
MESILNNSKNLNQTRPHPPITDRTSSHTNPDRYTLAGLDGLSYDIAIYVLVETILFFGKEIDMNRQRSIIELEIDQYERLLKIRKILSFLLLILTISWIFLTSFAGSIPFSSDPTRIILAVFIGIVAPTLLATNFYGLKDKDNYFP